MRFTLEEKIREAWTAPYDAHFLTRGTQVIHRPGWYQVIAPASKNATLNEVILSILSEEETDRVIQETIGQYKALGLPFKWCVGPYAKPLNMGERLERLGFKKWEVRGMVCDPNVLRFSIPPEVTIEPVTENNLDAFVEASIAGWHGNQNLSPSEQKGIREDFAWAISQPGDRYRYFLARYEGEKVGTAGVILKQTSAYLVSANVLPSFQNKGIYRALIEARLGLLRSLGVTLATTQARETTSAPILARLGFETVFRYWMYQLS